MTRADDGALQHIERGEQGGGAVPFVVVGHRAGAARFHRQAGLRSWQRLDWAFLIDAERARLSGGLTYSPTTSVSFSINAGSLDRLNVRTRCGRNPCASQIRWRCCAVAIDRKLHCVAFDGAVCNVASPTCCSRAAVICRLRPRPGASGRPSPTGAATGAPCPGWVEPRRDVFTRHATRRQQHDSAAEHPSLRRHAGAHPALQRDTMLVGEDQGRHSMHEGDGTKPRVDVQADSRSLH